MPKILRDKFGNTIDPISHYAYGKILKGPTEETYKALRARGLCRRRIEKLGIKSVYNFTGLSRAFLLEEEDLKKPMDEFIGPSFFDLKKLKELAIEHMGGNTEEHDVCFFNRTAGALAVTIATLARGGTVIGASPPPYCHPSIPRGCRLAGANFIEVKNSEELRRVLEERKVDLAVIVGASMTLEIFSEDELKSMVEMCKDKGVIVFIDDASGARLRPILYDQPRSLELGADFGETSTDKSGFVGPRCGFLVGRKDLMRKIAVEASEVGVDMRLPMMISVLRTLESFDPKDVILWKELGDAIYQKAVELYGRRVRKTPIGLTIEMEDALEIAMEKAGLAGEKPAIVPVEASCACSMMMLEDYGIITIAAIDMPGSTFSIRLRPLNREGMRFGGPDKIIEALDKSFDRLSRVIMNPREVSKALMGV